MTTPTRATPDRSRCPHCGRGRPGRPQTDDRQALELARALLAAGLARSLHDACTRAALLTAPNVYARDAVRDRLRRKIARNVLSEDSA